MASFALPLAVIGAIVGSFVGAVVIRLPAGRGIVDGRSSCDSCATPLGTVDLVPILSFAWLKGRCRSCGAPIAVDQLIAEVACMAIGVLVALSSDSISAALLLTLFGWTLVALALLDARHQWLPDRLTLGLLAIGISGALIVPEPPLVERLSGAIAGYAVLELIRLIYRYARGRDGIGGGDPKLFAAIGAWLGVAALPWVLLGAASLGLLIVAWRKARSRPVSRYDRLPLGTLLSTAAVAAMPFCLTLG